MNWMAFPIHQVFNEKNITVSDAPGMGIKGFVPGKVTYLDD